MESAKNASDYLAAANAAADVAARAAKQLNQAIAAPTPEATVEVTIRNLPTAQGWNWYELKVRGHGSRRPAVVGAGRRKAARSGCLLSRT